MDTTTSVRQTAVRVLDGMSVHVEKFARNCLAMCDSVDALNRALQRERLATIALRTELTASQEQIACLQKQLAKATELLAGELPPVRQGSFEELAVPLSPLRNMFNFKKSVRYP